MKTLFTLLLCTLLSYTNAQSLDRLLKKTQKSTEKKLEQKATKATNDGMDDILNTKDKSSKSADNSTNETTSKTKVAKNNSDFVAGSKVIYEDNFKSDALGDFPVNWFTNSSGELVAIDGTSSKWLQISDKGSFTPLNITKLPENFTLEFDVTTTDNFNFYSSPLNIVFTEKTTKADNVYNPALRRKEAVIFNVHPANSSMGTEGNSSISVISEKKEIMKNKVVVPTFNKNNHSVRVQVWRQKNRFRLYVDGKKYWDLPTAFGDANYNQIIFFIGTYKKTTDKFFITNLRLAEAGSDKRHQLIETGSFTTSEILFDTNKATLKSASAVTLKDLGTALQENSAVKISITGHTDNVGKVADNQKLSEQRAESVKEYLNKNFNIDKTRMVTFGKGSNEPVTDNSSEDKKQQNRRVEFIVID